MNKYISPWIETSSETVSNIFYSSSYRLLCARYVLGEKEPYATIQKHSGMTYPYFWNIWLGTSSSISSSGYTIEEAKSAVDKYIKNQFYIQIPIDRFKKLAALI
jgi:hypothetical protein